MGSMTSERRDERKAPIGRRVPGGRGGEVLVGRPAVANRYRVWIFAVGNSKPNDPDTVPPDAAALEVAERGTMSAWQAARYVETFNKTAQSVAARIRAVALPVAVHYEGEPRAGQTLRECLPER